MIPVYLRLTNFMSHVNSEIQFDELDLITLIVGTKQGNDKSSNGSGKSSIFDAITWVLYEKSRASGSASTSIDSVVRGGTDVAEVEFHFRLREDLYRVIRTRDQGRKKSDIVFEVWSNNKWRSVGADNKKDTAKKITNTIGLEHDVFINSVLLEQHEASNFARMTSGERKDVVTKILQLGHYDEYGTYAKKRLEELDAQSAEFDIFVRAHADAEDIQAVAWKELESIQEHIKAHQKRVKALKVVLEGLRKRQAEANKKILAMKDLLEQRDKIRSRIQQSTMGLKEVAVKIKKYESELEVLSKEVKEKRERILGIKKRRGDPSLIRKGLKELKQKVKDLTEQQTAATIKVQTLSSQLETLQEEKVRVEDMDEGSCPTCYQDITSDSKQEALKLFIEKIATYQQHLDRDGQLYRKVSGELEGAEKAFQTIQKTKDAFNKMQEEGRILMEALGSLQKSLITVSEAYNDAKEYRKEHTNNLAAAQGELNKCLEKIEELGSIDEDHFRNLTTQIIEKNTEEESEEKITSELQQKVGGLQERIETQKTVLDKIKKIREQRESLDRERRIEKELINAFSKTGIQALILENSAVEIERIANDLLATLTDGTVNIQIQTQKPNQDGTLKEVFDIIITDEYHSSPFALYSGGEQFRIAFVIRMALSILLARRAGVKVSTIFYDEAFQDLDPDGIDRMVEVFKLLSRDFRNQLVITHTSELKNYFDDVITVKKTPEGSFVVKN